jgi:FkbM family methyltransferase
MRKIVLLVYKIVAKFLSKLFGCYPIKFYPLRVFDNLIVSYLKSSFAEVQGHKMFIDPTDVARLSIFGVLEPLETEIFKKEIKKGDVVLDIGANIGYYTLIAARLVGEKGKVFAFEPHPQNFALLKKNIKLNGYKNVTLVEKAVSNKNKKLKLYLSGYDCGAHSLYNSHKGQHFVEVESIRLDDYFSKLGKKIDFVKIDVEGAEYEALQGMSKIIKRNKDIKIVTEFYPALFKKSGIAPEEFLEFLTREGFNLYNINELEKKIEPVYISEFLKKYNPKKRNNTNLLCLREKETIESPF